MTQVIFFNDPATTEIYSLSLHDALPILGGVSVDTAVSAEAALDRIAAEDYDAIVTDIKMPGMDGLELLAEIRSRRPGTPTLLITGHGGNEPVGGAPRRGACGLFQKPVDPDHFV